MGPVKGEIQPEDRENDRATDAPRPHGIYRRPAAPTENSRQVIKKMITAQGRKQKHSARKGNSRFYRGKGRTGCLSNKINPFCSSSCTGRNRHLRAPHRQREQAAKRDAAMPENAQKEPERRETPCGARRRTLRQVLEYSAESTRVACGKYAATSRKPQPDGALSHPRWSQAPRSCPTCLRRHLYVQIFHSPETAFPDCASKTSFKYFDV